MNFSHRQSLDVIALLWDYLKRDREHRDRKQTGWGTKTQAGLIASLEEIVNNRPGVDADKLFEAHWNSTLGDGLVTVSSSFHATLYGTTDFNKIKDAVHRAFVAGTKAVPR